MKRGMIILFLVLAFTVTGSFAFAQEKPTQEEAKAMVDKAAAYVKEVGKEKAFEEFNNPSGKFVKGELYIFAQSFKGIMLSHGANVKMVGQDHLELKDATGKQFVKEMVEVAKTKGNGWVEYSWTHPQNKKVQPKVTYIQKAGEDYYLGCGMYK